MSRMRSFLRRLDVRLVLTLSSVAVLSLLVSGLAVFQILPAYFEQQAEARLASAAIASELYTQEVAKQVAVFQPQLLSTRDVREGKFLAEVAAFAAENFVQGTVEFFNQDGSLAARASPSERNVTLPAAPRLAPRSQSGCAATTVRPARCPSRAPSC